ncbi:MAG: response regulator transcription factor [Deltaproteobacteria bacterium]|nr:response regulator transcription factor [Deltaproteobacteria bacterium]
MAETAAPSRRILIVEDDAAITTGLSINLRYEGYHVDIARDGRTGLDRALNGGYDLVILDVMMPELNGFEVLRGMRAAGARTRVLMLSAKGSEADKVMGLQLGADDYMSKPFGLQELLARVGALMRRPADEPRRLHAFGDVVVDLAAGKVTRGGEPVNVTSTELALLQCLMERPGRVQDRESLLRRAWGADYEGTARTVDNFVRALRTKLEADPENPRYIVTVRGMGYRFEG